MRYLLISIFLFIFYTGNLFCQTDEELELHSEGDPWNFYPTKEYNAKLPNVLLIGNSVMNGFKNTVSPELKGKMNVDYWLTPKHLNSEVLFEDMILLDLYYIYNRSLLLDFNILFETIFYEKPLTPSAIISSLYKYRIFQN